MEQQHKEKWIDLRSKAMELFNQNNITKFPEDDYTTSSLPTLIHELEVHQIELELQNEQLLQTQEQLKRSRDQYMHLFNYSPVGYFTLSNNLVISEVNFVACTLLSTDYHKVVDHRFTDFIHFNYQDIFYLHIKKLYETKVHLSCELKLLRHNDKEFYVRLESILVPNSDNIRITIVDISEQKKMEAQLIRSQRIELLGQLVGGIAHNFNNLLTIIITIAEYRLSEINEGDKLYEDLLQIINTGDKAAEIIRQLVIHAYPVKAILLPVNLNEFLESEHIIFTRYNFDKKNITHELKLLPNLSQVKIDKHLFRQVLDNIIINAYAAMKNGDKLTIQTEEITVSKDKLIHIGLPYSGRFVLVKISDTGHGMTEQIQSKVFNPFFTTRSIGTGLGLTISLKIVKDHGGTINVESQLEKGSTFKIYLPVHT
jgi:PAS domain S-box-containing protein